MILRERIPTTTPTRDAVSFDAFDEKGRQMGVMVVMFEADYIDKYKAGCCGYETPAGHYFMANVTATRNGKNFGASQRMRAFSTVIERANWIADRVQNSEKTAARRSEQTFS